MCVWFVKESLILRQRVTAIICVLFLFFYHAASLSVDQSTAVKACSAQGCLKKGKGSPYSVTEHRVPELIPVFGSQPADDVNHKRGGMLPFLSTRPGVTLATLKRAATNFAAWWTQARWVWTVCLRLLLDSIAAAIWTQALLHLSPACYRATRLFSHAILFSPRVWNLPLVSEISFRLPLHQACANLSSSDSPSPASGTSFFGSINSPLSLSITPSLFHSRLKPSHHSLPFLHDWLMYSLTGTSGHICSLLCSFSFFHFLVFGSKW